MLNKRERAVLGAIYEKCLGQSSCLITANEIQKRLPNRVFLSSREIENVVKSLELDDYLDVVFSEKKGQPILCINLHAKGVSFKREMVQLKRTVIIKLVLALMSALVTFAIGKLLFYFFK